MVKERTVAHRLLFFLLFFNIFNQHFKIKLKIF